MSPPAAEMIKRMLNKKRNIKFPQSLRGFAASLHFHSPAAYSYVRKTFFKCLPHPTTLRRWMQNVHCNSGISDKAIQNVLDKIQIARKNNKKLIFNLTLDEMNIKKKIDWDGKESHGFVEVGTEKYINNNLPLATQVLVVMLVCINDHFKIPIAYYFIHSLNGREKTNLISNILCELYKHNIDVVSITFDGAPSNISMCEILGAQLKECHVEKLVPYFTHPADESKRIRIFYDACHMIKLVRNTFAQEDITDENDNTISWMFIAKLVNLQEIEKLHVANKIRQRHVNFSNEKMKVNLAVQVLSNSVRDALTFVEHDLKLPEFFQASATATFCKYFNDIFDLMNSRNLYNKTETKRAITKDNLFILKNKVETFTLYINSLKIRNSPVLQTVRKTGFVGFIINLKNVIALAEELFNDNKIDFLLTYKLSQDHLETFFSSIRRMNGWNNNPSAKQFKASYKKILHLVNVSVSLNANCILQDDTELLQLSNESMNNEKKEIDNLQTVNTDFEQDLLNTVLTDHDYLMKNSWCVTEYATEIITYISGYIAKNIIKKINCSICKKLLIKNTTQKDIYRTDKLLQRKNRSGLCEASNDVITICKKAEKTFRLNQHIAFKTKNIVQHLILQTLQSLPSYVFYDNHVFDQSPLFDHRGQIIKLI